MSSDPPLGMGVNVRLHGSMNQYYLDLVGCLLALRIIIITRNIKLFAFLDNDFDCLNKNSWSKCNSKSNFLIPCRLLTSSIP